MPKGKIRIYTGTVLIILQALAVLGNPQAGFLFVPELFLTSIAYLVGYWGHAICGGILVKLGLNAKRTYEDVSLQFNGAQTGIFSWLNYAVAGIMMAFLGVAVHDFIDTFRSRVFLSSLSSLYHDLLSIIAQVFMILYLLVYVGRKPSHLVPAALGFSSAAYFYAILPSVGTLLSVSFTAPATVCMLLGAGLYAALGIYSLRGSFHTRWIRILGGAGSGLMVLGSFLPALMAGHGFTVPTDVALHVSVFVYSVVAPLGDPQ